jgi:hypothetical protein
MLSSIDVGAAILNYRLFSISCPFKAFIVLKSAKFGFRLRLWFWGERSIHRFFVLISPGIGLLIIRTVFVVRGRSLHIQKCLVEITSLVGDSLTLGNIFILFKNHRDILLKTSISRRSLLLQFPQRLMLRRSRSRILFSIEWWMLSSWRLSRILRSCCSTPSVMGWRLRSVFLIFTSYNFIDSSKRTPL